MVKCDHAPLQNLYTQSQLVPRNPFNYTPYWFQTYQEKRKCANWQLSRLRCLGLHKDNDPEKSGWEYGKSIFDTDNNTVCSVESNQNINNKFEIDDIKFCLPEKDLANLQCQDTDAHIVDTNSLSCMYNLDPEKMKQLQQDMHITKIIDKCKSK